MHVDCLICSILLLKFATETFQEVLAGPTRFPSVLWTKYSQLPNSGLIKQVLDAESLTNYDHEENQKWIDNPHVGPPLKNLCGTKPGKNPGTSDAVYDSDFVLSIATRPNGTSECFGAPISDQYIIIPAHCVVGYSKVTITTAFRLTKASDWVEDISREKHYEVEETCASPNHTSKLDPKSGRPRYGWDVAVLRLKGRLELGDFYQTNCMPSGVLEFNKAYFKTIATRDSGGMKYFEHYYDKHSIKEKNCFTISEDSICYTPIDYQPENYNIRDGTPVQVKTPEGQTLVFGLKSYEENGIIVNFDILRNVNHITDLIDRCSLL